MLYRTRRRRRPRPRRRRRKRRYRSKSGLGRTLMPRYNTVRNMRVGFPTSVITKLRYCDEYQFDPIAGTWVDQVFRANSVYDPDHTGVGHQPLGFDQWMTAYNHWQVIGSKIKVTMIGTGSASAVPAIAFLQLSDVNNNSTISNLNELQEQPNVISRIVSGQLEGARNLNAYFSSKRFFKRNFNQSGLIGTASADPSEQAYYILTVGAVDESDDAAEVICRVQIDYIVRFTEPKKLEQS